MAIEQQQRIKVAIVGAGPGGLASAIHLLRLPQVQVSVFEKASELREVGAGISINQNTWRHLQVLGAADKIEQFTKRGDGTKVDSEHRNGRTGELLSQSFQSVDPNKPARSRIERYKLQQALLSVLPADLIQLKKNLTVITETPDSVSLSFEDGTTAGPFDVVIGADGLRSAVRQYAFPDHKISFTGKVAYRVLIPYEKVAHIKGIPDASTFWHTKDTHVYTDKLDSGLFEIATRALETEENGNKVSWGQKVSKDKVVKHYKEYTEPIRQVLDVPDEWLEFAMFGGPRLEKVVKGRIALLGDASHPLSGAFGSGAAFAFEDAYILSQTINKASKAGRPLTEALEEYDAVRSPHYANLFKILGTFGNAAKEADTQEPPLDHDQYVSFVHKRNWATSHAWIYDYNVIEVWEAAQKDSAAAPATAAAAAPSAPTAKEARVPTVAATA